MAQISIIEYNDIKKVNRIDAEYFRPKYLAIEKILKNKKHQRFEDFSFITDGIHSSIDFDENSEILLFSAKAPKENTFDVSGLKHISHKQHIKNPRTALKENDVIISTVGTIGNCAVITKNLLPANSDRHVGIIRPEGVSSFLLSTFLLSKYGRMQSSRNVVGNVQPNLHIRDMKKFIIPIFSRHFEQDIERIVLEAHHKISYSKKLYKQAEQILLTELNLIDYKAEHSLTFETTSNKIENATRFDAEYFQPKYEEIIKRIENYSGGYASLIEFIDTYSTGYPFNSKSYINTGIYLIRINNIEKGNLNLDNAVKIPNSDKYLSEKDLVKKNDILISMSGTIGNACRIPKNIEAIINQRIFKLTPKNFNSEVLTLIINSILGYSQLERIGTGGVQTNISGSEIKKIKIPIIHKNIQEKIANKIQESHKLRKESKELLELAKRKVEEEIEKE